MQPDKVGIMKVMNESNVTPQVDNLTSFKTVSFPAHSLKELAGLLDFL
jgi:hypothetical protein